MDVAGVIDRLHRLLLSWDYYNLLDRSINDNKGVYDHNRKIPSTFSSVQEYKEVFEPLILEECGAQILRGIEDTQVLTPKAAVVASCSQLGDFHIAKVLVEADVASSIHDNDLLLLTQDHPEQEESSLRRECHALGFVEGHEGPQGLRVKFYLSDDSQAGNSDGIKRVRSMRPRVEKPRTKWWLLRLFNMSTISREWVALQHAHLLPWLPSLLCATPMEPKASAKLDIPGGMRAAMMRTCNAPQMAALQAGLSGSPLLLIQGPPGTGKTSTILNLLSVVLHAAEKGSLDLLPRSMAAAEEEEDGGGGGGGGGGSTAAQELALAQLDGMDDPEADLALPEDDVDSNQQQEDEEEASGSEASDGMEVDRSTDLTEHQQRLWAQQAPWLFGLPVKRDTVVPGPDTGLPEYSPDCFGLSSREPVYRIGEPKGPKAHVLVCAPSNSALDEIVLRILKSGLMNAGGGRYNPSLVRVGVNVHHSVAEVSLERLVDARLGMGAQETGAARAVSVMQREKLKLTLLREAAVVCSTLSFAGSAVFHRLGAHFDVVVIDEAGQAVEPSTMVPLVLGCKQVFLVGDPAQLPATVISKHAVELGYSTSMFSRLQHAGYPVHMLTVQYRMHPLISAWPSREFYQGQLVDGEGVAARTTRPWHALRYLGPFAFYDVDGKEEVPEGQASMVNRKEAEFVVALHRELLRQVGREEVSVAVISPYKAQVLLLKELFAAALGEGARAVDINTIDGFQGREKDVVIFSAVRTTGAQFRSIGFVADQRRINVGLTRARCALLVVGCLPSLMVDGYWCRLIGYAVENSVMFRAQKPWQDYLRQLAAGEVGPANVDAKTRMALGLVQGAAPQQAAGSKSSKRSRNHP